MISFAEIVQGRDASVRVTVDGLIYAVDLVMVMTGKSNNESNECLRELNPSLFNKENFFIRSRSRLVSFQHAIELIMVLPGKVAKEVRVQFADVIRRYMAGDESLIDEIEANARSSSPVARMARATLGDGEDERDRKRRRLMEDAQTQSLQNKNRSESLGIISTSMDLMTRLNPGWTNDGRFLLQLQDQVMNIAASPSAPTAITNGDHAPLTISEVARGLGRSLNHGQLIQVGKLVAKAYRQRHNADPPSHQQYVDGATRLIKSYTEADRDLIEEAIMDV
jgi:hypothetical protein